MKKWKIKFFLAALLLISSSSTYCKSNPEEEKVKELVESAYSYGNAGDYAKAAETFNKAIAIDPNFFAAHMGLGTLYLMTENDKEAKIELKKAIELDSEKAIDAYYNLIMLLLYEENMEALEYYNAFMKIAPNDQKKPLTQTIVWSRLYGMKRSKSGFSIPVERELNEAMNPNLRQTLTQVSNYESLNNFKKAAETLEGSLSNKMPNTDKAYASYHLGKLYFEKLNSNEMGIKFVERAISLDPAEIRYRIYLVDYYKDQLQNKKKTFEELDKLEKAAPKNKYYPLTKGGLYYNDKQWTEAVSNWKELANRDKFLFGIVENEFVTALCWDLSKKYNGKEVIRLKWGPKVKPDKYYIEGDSYLLYFKLVQSDPEKYEMDIAIPANDIESINGKKIK